MTNYKLSISYDGTDYYGFQIQKDKITVQGEFQKVLEVFTNDYELNYSGRTDAGVHAKAQILSLKTNLLKSQRCAQNSPSRAFLLSKGKLSTKSNFLYQFLSKLL